MFFQRNNKDDYFDGPLTADDIARLQKQAKQEGWSFEVAENPATRRPDQELIGAVIPSDAENQATYDPCTPKGQLPSSYDWREYQGVPPIRDQDGCGSCWAFGAVAAFECEIKIHTGEDVDLSEQWLVSCTDSGSCSGGWHSDALDHMTFAGLTDPCGDFGAVLEEDFPYEAWDMPCGCPYEHPYWIDRWNYVGEFWGVAEVDQIKQAILDHGPVTTCIYASMAFKAYDKGVFDACQGGGINHVVALVGWDDAYYWNGDYYGVWILRNSWGTDWGEDGYMYITYGCNKVGFATTYVDALTGPVIESVTVDADEVMQGSLFTMTAEDVSDPDGYINHVSFFYDANDNCLVDSGDITLYKDGEGSDGWAAQVPAQSLPIGTIQLMARAKDNEGIWSIPKCIMVTVLKNPGDATGDGLVNIDDLLFVLSYWGSDHPMADLTGDGIVDIDDVLLVLEYWT